MQSDLPFARGTTFCDGDATTIALLDGELEGKRYKDYDPTTGGEQELIVVKATQAITAPGGGFMAYTTGYWGKRTAGLVGTAATYGVCADPAYTGDVASGDLFYCIYAGEVSGAKVSTSNLTQGGAVSLHSDGFLLPLASGDAVCIGMSNAAVTAGVAGAVTATIQVLPPGAATNIA